MARYATIGSVSLVWIFDAEFVISVLLCDDQATNLKLATGFYLLF